MNTASKILTVSAIATIASSANLLRPTPTENTNDTLPSGLKIVKNDFPYGCTNSTLLNSDYISSSAAALESVCSKIEEEKTYGLEGGDVIQKTNGACHINKNFTGVPDQLACGNWNEGKVTVVDAKTCPADSTLISNVFFGSKVLEDICPQITSRQSLKTREGYVKTVSAFPGVCVVEAFPDMYAIQKLACVSPILESLKPTESVSEKACGENQSLVTVEEFKKNEKAICKHLETTTKRGHLYLRLAGGAELFAQPTYWSSEYTCKIGSKNWAPMDYGLCADANRKSL